MPLPKTAARPVPAAAMEAQRAKARRRSHEYFEWAEIYRSSSL
jgi:hypothetical protein